MIKSCKCIVTKFEAHKLERLIKLADIGYALMLEKGFINNEFTGYYIFAYIAKKEDKFKEDTFKVTTYKKLKRKLKKEMKNEKL